MLQHEISLDRLARLDQTYPLELRKLLRVELLIVDDFALQSLDQTETQDIYEIVVERHEVSSTIVRSNREPKEWLDVMADQMLAQSAVDRVTIHKPIKSSMSREERERVVHVLPLAGTACRSSTRKSRSSRNEKLIWKRN